MTIRRKNNHHLSTLTLFWCCPGRRGEMIASWTCFARIYLVCVQLGIPLKPMYSIYEISLIAGLECYVATLPLPAASLPGPHNTT
jgi:uncharacterized membrane protein